MKTIVIAITGNPHWEFFPDGHGWTSHETGPVGIAFYDVPGDDLASFLYAVRCLGRHTTYDLKASEDDPPVNARYPDIVDWVLHFENRD